MNITKTLNSVQIVNNIIQNFSKPVKQFHTDIGLSITLKKQ